MDIIEEKADNQVRIIEDKYVINNDVYNFAKFSGEIGVGIFGLGKFTKGVSALKGGIHTVLAIKNSTYGYQGASTVVNTSTYISNISSQISKVTTSISLSFSSFKEGFSGSKDTCSEVGDENYKSINKNNKNNISKKEKVNLQFFAKKNDLKQVDAAARIVGVNRKQFGSYIHKIKSKYGMRGDDVFSFEELLELAKDFKDLMR